MTMDTLRPGMRGRLRTAPCKTVAACAGARVREEGDGERHSERERACVRACVRECVCACMHGPRANPLFLPGGLRLQ